MSFENSQSASGRVGEIGMYCSATKELMSLHFVENEVVGVALL